MVIRSLGCWLIFALGILAQSGGTITGTVVDLGGVKSKRRGTKSRCRCCEH